MTRDEAASTPTLATGGAARRTPASEPAPEPGPASTPTEPEVRQAGSAWRAVLVFLGLAVVVWAVASISLSHLPYTGTDLLRHPFPGQPWFESWIHFDGRWYTDIAKRGYWTFVEGEQGPMAFFPAYPFLMRAGSWVVGDIELAGIFITLTSGAASAGLYFMWLRDRVSTQAAWTALLLFALYPYSYYLYGVVYADALFIASALAAFVLLEKDRPVWAGVAGIIAAVARPVGPLVVLALVIRAVERRGGLRQVRWRDAGVLIAGVGFGAFCIWSWSRFGSPLTFVDAQRGWDQDPGPATWLKFQFFEDIRDFRSPLAWTVYVSHAVVTLTALALVPRVVRRFGWGYGSYVVLTLGVAALSTKNFFGMGRYVLAAFPCFAVGGELLAQRPRLRTAALGASGLVMLTATSFFARGHYLS